MVQPARDDRELMMIVVVVNHLLDVVVVTFVVIVVIAVVADVLTVADPVAYGGNGAGDWRDRLSLSPIPAALRATLETTPLPAPLGPSLSKDV